MPVLATPLLQLALAATLSTAPAPLMLGGIAPLAIRPDTDGTELPVHAVPDLGRGAEFYFSPDSRHLIGNARREGDDGYRVYTFAIDGGEVHRVNDVGSDACSFYFPDGKRVVWTSTRDWLDLPVGNYSDPANYPQGAELYSSGLDGADRIRLTENLVYDAEVTVSPDGRWILFSRQIDGKLDLWRMRSDGSDPRQITHTASWQEGGAAYLPDSKTIIYRAWHIEDQGRRSPLPMEIFTIRDDGTHLRQVTADSGTNWAPYPAPDGHHYFFVKVLPPRNFEIFLGDLDRPGVVRVTYHDGFDGFPAVSPDGKWLGFASNRTGTPGELTEYLMDISSLGVGPR
jgi:Tol biopolymer transport system component